ncbi:MAG: YbaY family lipoprotein [Parcubacteria group bacterium]
MNKKVILGIIVGVIIVAIAIYAIFVWKPSPSVPEAPSAELTGTVSYRERIALPSGSIIDVQIRDVSEEDDNATAKIVAEENIVTSGENVPIPFAIKYNPEDIISGHVYTVFARIFMDDELRWVTDTPTFLLEEEEPIQNVDLMLSATSTSSEGALKTEDLEGKTFRIASYNGVATDLDYEYTVAFSENSINAHVCNAMFGGFALTNSTLRGMLASTLMYCIEPAEMMNIEDALKSLLTSGASASLSGDTLTLSGSGKTLVLTEIQ